MRRKRLPPKGWNKDRPFGLGGPLNSGHGDLAPARGPFPRGMRPPLSSSQSPLSSVSACGENCACSLAPPLPTAKTAPAPLLLLSPPCGARRGPRIETSKKMRRARWKRKNVRRVGLRQRRPPAAGEGWLAVPRGSQRRKRPALGETSGPGKLGIPFAPLFAAAGRWSMKASA